MPNGERFDCIVGNPPYQEVKDHGKKVTGNGARWVKFTLLGIDICKDDGYLAFIIPDSWTAPTYDLMGSRKSIFNDYFKKYNLQTILFDLHKYFPKIGISPSAFILQKNKNYEKTNIISEKSDMFLNIKTMKFIPKDTSFLSLSIHKKVLSNFENKCLFKMRWIKTVTGLKGQDNKDEINKYPLVDSYSFKPMRWTNKMDPDIEKRKIFIPRVGKYQCIIDNDGILGGKSEVSVRFLKDNESGDNVKSFFNSKLINYIMNSNKWTQYLLVQILNYIPVEDFTRSWTDAEIYDHFKLTKAEIKYIENSVK